MTPRRIQERLFPKTYAHVLLRIAEGDWHTANALKDQQGIRIENLFYLAEQAIEKSLKAVLCYLGQPIPLVHELGALVAKFPQEIDLPFGYEIDQLTQFATVRRYEEGIVSLTKEEQTSILKTSKEILEWAKIQLNQE